MSLIYAKLPDGSANPAWLEARRGRITASEVYRLMSGRADVRGTYMRDLLTERLVGVLGEQKVTEAMQAGIDREATAAKRYEEETGHSLIQGYWIWDEQMGFGGTPDYIVTDGGGVEIKCPQPRNAIAARFGETLGAKWRNEQEYYWQCAGYRLLTGEPWWDLGVYSQELKDVGLDMYIDRAPTNKADDDRLVDAVFEANAILTKAYDEALSPKRLWVEKTLIPAIERAQSHEAIQELENEVYKLGAGALPPAIIAAIDEAVRLKTLQLPDPMG